VKNYAQIHFPQTLASESTDQLGEAKLFEFLSQHRHRANRSYTKIRNPAWWHSCLIHQTKTLCGFMM